MPHTISSYAYDVVKMGYLVEKTGWTPDYIRNAPAGEIDDLLTYFQEKAAEQHRLDEQALKKND